MTLVPRLLKRFAEEISAADSVAGDRLRAERIGYLAAYGALKEARSELLDLRRRYDVVPHALIGPWIIFADSLVDRASVLHDSSLLKMRRAHALSRAGNQVGLHALSAAWLAHLYWNLQDITTSVELAEEALAVRPADDKAALIRVSLVLGEALLLARHERAGQRWYVAARASAQQLGDIPSLSALTYNLTSVRLMLFRQEVLSRATDSSRVFVGARTSQSFDEAMGMSCDERTILQQARVLSLQGEAKLALDLFVKHGQANVLEGRRIRAEWLADEAWCRARTGDLDGAMQTANSAIEAVVKETQVDDLAATHSRLAKTFQIVGLLEQAAEHKVRANKLWRQYEAIQMDFGEKFALISRRYMDRCAKAST